MVENEDNKKLSLLADDLASLENYIHDLFSFSPLPICFISPIGVVLEVNPSFEALSKLKSYELIGEPIEKVFGKEEIGKLTEDTLEKGFVEGREATLFPREKERIPVQVFTRVRRDEKGEIVGYFLGLYDLSKVKQVQEGLKEAQAALMNILEDTEEARRKAEEERNKTQEIITSLNDGLLVFDRENFLSLINPQAENFLEVDQKKLIGKSVDELSKIDKVKPLADILGKDIKTLFRQELTITQNFILEVSTVPLTESGRRIGSLIVLHDISREKMVERMKTEFVSISAHQLRTPLSAIKWTLRMLLDGDLGKITSEQRSFIEKTYVSNERMINLINDLLNVTRIEEGRYLYKPVLSEIEKVIQFIIDSYKEQAERKNIKLVFKKPKEKLPKVLLDTEKMNLAVQNLVDNAVRYTPSKGSVTVSLNYDKKDITVSVKDTGIGIPEDQKERVFSRFFRGANVIKMETEGSGLGLFISKNIIESHGGKIWFDSEEGKGATFYFSIPFKQKNFD
jgi:PAS domain S-box-containing protein